MKHTDLWNTYDGWKALGYHVNLGEKAKKKEWLTGHSLFFITQVSLKGVHSAHDYWAQETDW